MYDRKNSCNLDCTATQFKVKETLKTAEERHRTRQHRELNLEFSETTLKSI